MTVVIHDFEVVAEKPPATEPAGASAAHAQPVPPSTPQDIDRVVRRIAERGARVRAH